MMILETTEIVRSVPNKDRALLRKLPLEVRYHYGQSWSRLMGLRKVEKSEGKIHCFVERQDEQARSYGMREGRPNVLVPFEHRREVFIREVEIGVRISRIELLFKKTIFVIWV